jgi:purine-binding chemotaxis protein CheW
MDGNEKTRKAPDNSAAALGGKYLTFRLAQEAYGIPILSVQEIIALVPITRIPRAAPSLRGAVNLRGRIVPVFDLRRKFGFGEVEPGRLACIVVAQLGKEPERITAGFVVDEVSDVVNLQAQEIDTAAETGSSLRSEAILGLARVKGRITILLDLDRVLAGDAALAASLAEQPAALGH